MAEPTYPYEADNVPSAGFVLLQKDNQCSA